MFSPKWLKYGPHLLIPPVTKKAAQAKKQQADCPKFGTLPSSRPEEGSDSEYEGSSRESEVEEDDIPGSMFAFFFQSSIANSILLRCFGDMPSTISFFSFFGRNFDSLIFPRGAGY